jgi:hypothetical protein
MTPISDPNPTANPLLKIGIYNITELQAYNAKTARQEYLVEGLIAQQSLTLAVGDSNRGKSPFFYQMAICVAAGVPFLGLPVKRGRVLYIDAENSTGQVEHLVTTLAGYVGLPEVPSDLLLFNMNNCPENYEVENLVNQARPTLVVLDPIYALFRDIEENAKAVTEAYSKLRRLMKICGCSHIGVHHPNKETDRPDAPKRQPLDKISDVRQWFIRARGSGALINGCDTRLAFDIPSTTGDCKLVVGGYARVRGALPMMRLARDVDTEGEPRGYRRLSGVQLLKPEWRETYAQLPDGDFHFKDVKPLLKDSADATANFLKACVAADILEHDLTVKPKGVYRKKLKTVPDLADAA